MGIRGEVFSSTISLPNRTYFFNVKENRVGDLYLNIVESKNRDSGGFDRQSVILFAEDLQEFLKGFDESLKVMEKAMREKKHTGTAKSVTKREAKSEHGERSDRYDKNRRDDKPPRERSDRASRDHVRRDGKPPRERGSREGKPMRERGSRSEGRSDNYRSGRGERSERSSAGRGERSERSSAGRGERSGRERSGRGGGEKGFKGKKKVVVRKRD